MGKNLWTQMKMMVPPTEDKHLVRKAELDEIYALLDQRLKKAVEAVSIENIDATYDATALTLTMADSETFDGVALTEGIRVLVAGQTSATQNGIYVVSEIDGDNAVLTRADDFDESSKITNNVIIPVKQGEVYGDTKWMLTNDGPVTLDTTPLTFETYVAPVGLQAVKKTFITDGTATDFTFQHDLANENVAVTVYDSDKNECVFGVKVVDANNVQISSGVVIDAGETFTVIVVG